MKRRLLASLMTLVMMLSLLPTAVLARDTGSGDPQEAEDAAEPAPKGGEEETPTPVNTADGKLDLADGSIVISATGYTQGGEKTEIQYTGAYIISQTSKGSTTNTITVTGGEHTITLNGVNIDVSGVSAGVPCAFAIESGKVTLVLADESENTLKSGWINEDNADTGISYAGLWVQEQAQVVINGGTGKLAAVGGGSGSSKLGNTSLAAGIGASCAHASNEKDPWKSNVGTITIEGGVITATGSAAGTYGGAGIGGGGNNSDITITGGNVTANSGKTTTSGCAGIGSAYGQPGKKHIVIKDDAVVNATGGSAGIGGGAYQGAGVILIDGGTVTAKSNDVGAGIGGGGGVYGGDNMNINGSITISGGTVTAAGSSYGAGIGGGGGNKQAYADAGAQASGNITISGGTVTAKGGTYAPGIGSGAIVDHNSCTAADVSGKMGTITISGGKVTAENGSSFADGGKSYRVPSGNNNLDSGIGQGRNASEVSQAAFADWELQTGNGGAVQLVAKESVSDLKRNGEAYNPATLVINRAEYYLLPEGCYNTGTGGAEVVIPSDAVTSTVTDLITALKNIDPNKGSFTSEEVEAVRGYAVTYNSLSESLQYYVDQQTEGHTLAEIQKAFKGKVDAKVTLKNGDETFDTKTLKYGEKYNLSGIVPTKANYRFVGWYLGDTDMTKGDNWPYLSDTTLEAKWESEITGTGEKSDPYIIKSGANLVALSHISLYGWDSANGKNVYAGTEEEFALFGKDGVTPENRAELMLAWYKLGDNVTLTTEDKFYGISGFKGHFNGDGHTITLNIDTTNIVESSDKDESGSEVAVGASSKRGKLKLTIGESTVYVNINMGVFNSATGATIENFTTRGSAKVLTNSAFTGVVIGESYGCTIKKITNEATLELGATDNTSWAGGIAGMVDSANSTSFVDCHNTAAIKGGTFNTSMGNSSAAGICSYQNASATYENCSNSGALIAERKTEASGRYSNAGGIVGLATGAVTATFKNCRNTGEISSQAQSNNVAAGIIVVNGSNTVITLDSCSNTAVITAKLGYAGSLVSCKSGTSGMPTSAEYTNCTHVMKGAGSTDYTFGSTKATAAEEGQVVLTIPVENNVDNFYAADHYVSANGEKVADIASADYQYIYNDFSHNGNIMEDSYPFQTEATAYVINTAEDYTNLVKALQGDADAQNAVLGNRFGNESTDAKKVALSNIYVKVNNDITLTDPDAMGIGSDARTFGGHILGQGHTITYNLSSDALSEAQSSSFGFVGVSDGAEVKDLNFAGNVNISVAPENRKNVYFGAAVVSGSGATITNCHSTVNYTVSRTSDVMNATGGFLEVGGLLGIQASATVENSTYTGSITVTSPKFARAGGIAAEFAGTMKNCVVKGNISAMLKYDSALPIFGESAYAGGMAGLVSSNSTFENCVAVGSMKAENTCNSADVGNYGCAYAGGLLGNSTADVTVKDCKALTTETAIASRGNANQFAGAFVGKEDKTLTLSGTNWYVKTTTVSVSDASAKPIDTTVLDGKTFGETVEMTVPTGVTMSSDYASLTGSTVSFIKAGNGTVNLVYDGQTFFTKEITVAQKPLSKDDVTITGINDKYPSHEAAEAAKDGIGIVYDGKKLTTDDYTVSREDGKFTITFEGNYSGTANQAYQVETGLPTVTVSDATFTYDGQNHTIVVNNPNNDDVKFSLSQSGYGAQIEKKAAGTYVIYWAAEKDSKTVSGSATLVITKAPLTIKADNQSMYVGGTVPTPTFTATGLVKGDTLTTAPTLTCTADGMTVGKFDIVPSGADAGNNYEITYVNGTLTVSRRHSSSSTTPEPTPDDSTSFVDVPANAYFADAVDWAVENGVTNGLSDTMFGPYESCTRAQIVTFLWRAAGSPEPKTASSFTDVSASAYYAKAVAWAVENGITNGMTETTFAPDATCTRGQSVTFLYRALKGTASGSANFTDVKPDAFYADAVNWAVANNVTNGTSATTFSPNADCTRAEIVTFLYRAYQGK